MVIPSPIAGVQLKFQYSLKIQTKLEVVITFLIVSCDKSVAQVEEFVVKSL